MPRGCRERHARVMDRSGATKADLGADRSQAGLGHRDGWLLVGEPIRELGDHPGKAIGDFLVAIIASMSAFGQLSGLASARKSPIALALAYSVATA